MEEAVSAAEANRKFSLILRGVREGRRYVVTSHGRPVARIVPAGGQAKMAMGARAALLARLEGSPSWPPAAGRATSFTKTSREGRARHRYSGPC